MKENLWLLSYSITAAATWERDIYDDDQDDDDQDDDDDDDDYDYDDYDDLTLLVVMLNLGPATPGNQRKAGVS